MIRQTIGFSLTPILFQKQIASPSLCINQPEYSAHPPLQHSKLQDLESKGVLTLVPRRADYFQKRYEPRGYIEPELVAIVGVSHLSEISAQAVTTVIEQLQPQAVVVELCRSRFGLLYHPNELESMPMKNDKLEWARLLRLGGLSAVAMQFMLSSFLKVTANGTDPGAEFRAARNAALKCDAEIVLGDRPIELTLRRAWNALSINEKFMLVITILRAALGMGVNLNNVGDEKLKETITTGIEAETGLLKKYKDMLAQTFPGVIRPLIEERDLYLAWSLKRSQAVRGKKCVVGVVGKAHVNGIIECMKQDDELRRRGEKPSLTFRDLVG